MSKVLFSVVLTMVTAGIACAGIEAAGPQAAALPQPSTVVICAIGMALFRLTSKRER